MTTANLITWTLLAITYACMFATWRRNRATAATAKLIASFTDRDHEALRLGWQVQRAAQHVGHGTCVSSGTVREINGRRLWVTVSAEDVPDEPGGVGNRATYELPAEDTTEASA